MTRSPNFNQINPDQAIAICSREQAEQLADFDHHRILVAGHIGLLLTSEWLPIKDHLGPFVLTVVFHHAEDHPHVPDEIQTLIDSLKFQVRGQPR